MCMSSFIKHSRTSIIKAQGHCDIKYILLEYIHTSVHACLDLIPSVANTCYIKEIVV